MPKPRPRPTPWLRLLGRTSQVYFRFCFQYDRTFHSSPFISKMLCLCISTDPSPRASPVDNVFMLPTPPASPKRSSSPNGPRKTDKFIAKMVSAATKPPVGKSPLQVCFSNSAHTAHVNFSIPLFPLFSLFLLLLLFSSFSDVFVFLIYPFCSFHSFLYCFFCLSFYFLFVAYLLHSFDVILVIPFRP